MRFLKLTRYYVWLAPTFLLLAVFAYWPPVLSLITSFFHDSGVSGVGSRYFIGWANFIKILHDSVFYVSIKHMLILTFVPLILSLAVNLLAAESLFSLRSHRWSAFYRFLILVPMATPTVVTSLVWAFFFSPINGLLNRFLVDIGLGQYQHAWLANSHYALASLIFMGMPWLWGLGVLILLAGLQSVPDTIFEAAALDGATGWKRRILVDFPLIKGQMKLLIILNIIAGMQNFFQPLVMTQGGPNDATMVPGLLMYQWAFANGSGIPSYGKASALGLLLFVGILTLTIVLNQFVRTEDEV